MTEWLIETTGEVAIIAATLASLDAEERDQAELARLLEVAPPVDWPPEHNGPDTRAWVRGLLQKHPREPGFATWYVIGRGRLCGTAGYKGPPDERGDVEIGYSIVAADRRNGFASGAVRLLVTQAFRDDRVARVVAETLPDNLASQAVLTRAGFARVANRMDPEDGELWCFAITRP